MLTFDAETARILDDAYLGGDLTRRGMASFDALAPSPGQRLLDIGCGTGLLALDLARAVGASGEVVGVEPSADMRAATAARSGGRENFRLVDGSANALPLGDGTFDGAVSVQVFEYLDDIPGALSEVRRVLRPGARLVIGDNHWDTLVWSSDVPERMARIIAAWDRHLVERRVPALLPAALRAAGFTAEAVTPVPVCDSVLRPDGSARVLMTLIERHVRDTGLAPAAAAWAEEQRDLAAAGRFFFALTHYVVTALRL